MSVDENSKQDDQKEHLTTMHDQQNIQRLADKENGYKKDIEDLKKKVQEYLQGWQRARADYLNLKKDTDEKFQEISLFANVTLLYELLPFIDNLDRALRFIPMELQQSDWVKGIMQVQKSIHAFIKKLGIEKIETKGKKFDPKLHEAVSHDENKQYKTDDIIDEVQAGWLLKGETLIPAKVKVAK